MCKFLSAIVTIAKHPKVLCRDLMSHDRTIDILEQKPETYREFEWTREDTGDSLDVRTLKGEDVAEFKSAILALYPRRIDCINECIQQIAEAGGGYLDLNGLASAEGLVLPQSISGSLYLSGHVRVQLKTQKH